MTREKNCPICGATSFTDVYSAPYFRGKREYFNIQECDNCKLWLTNPHPDEESLGEYYETEDYISHTNKKEGIIDYLYHWVRKYSLGKKVSLINRLVPQKGHLLDFGAGTGHFLAEARKAGWDVTGIEPSEEARAVAKKEHEIDLSSPTEYEWGSSNKADVISLWHVLEHLPDLYGHMNRFEKALKPGGFLIIAVPNHESYDSKYYKEHWAALDVPLHLYHFKKSNMEMLAEKHGFLIHEIKNMPFDAFYVSMLSEKVKTGKNDFVNAFKIGFESNSKGLSTKNASSLIYILKKP